MPPSPSQGSTRVTSASPGAGELLSPRQRLIPASSAQRALLSLRHFRHQPLLTTTRPPAPGPRAVGLPSIGRRVHSYLPFLHPWARARMVSPEMLAPSSQLSSGWQKAPSVGVSVGLCCTGCLINTPSPLFFLCPVPCRPTLSRRTLCSGGSGLRVHWPLAIHRHLEHGRGN